jgi:DNA-binding CsgD family transcriptional regulator
MKKLDQFISRLYRSTQQVTIAHFRDWALKELQALVPFDAAIWSTGHLSTRTFHTHTTLGLPQQFPDLLIQHLPINPISKALFNHAGNAVDMRDVIEDDNFFQSDIYKLVFQPHRITRVLSSLHIESRSGIYTLLSIYRFDKQSIFTDQEKDIYQRALYHLLESASHACMLSMRGADASDMSQYAICDQHGVYHETEPHFLDMIEEAFPSYKAFTLPLELPINLTHTSHCGFIVKASELGDLYRVSIRHANPLDQLTERERQVVHGVTTGLSFKLIAKQLNLSPSTISNHLYRIYQKLNINNRAELADLIE